MEALDQWERSNVGSLLCWANLYDSLEDPWKSRDASFQQFNLWSKDQRLWAVALPQLQLPEVSTHNLADVKVCAMTTPTK